MGGMIGGDAPRKLVRVDISKEIIVEFFTTGEKAFRTAGIPDGSKIISFHSDHMIVTHESFKEVPYGGKIPKVEVMFYPLEENV